jgi:hypothetical protein
MRLRKLHSVLDVRYWQIFERRPPKRMDGIFIPASEKPAQRWTLGLTERLNTIKSMRSLY